MIAIKVKERLKVSEREVFALSPQKQQISSFKMITFLTFYNISRLPYPIIQRFYF